MLSKRVASSFSTCELQALRSQWLRSGKCYRCFHASLRRMTDEVPNRGNQAAPLNAPQRGPTRQQRAAMVSKEVEMLQRDRPSPSFGEADPNTLRPPGASQTIDPEAIGLNVGGGAMGQNDVPSQEGPLAQGIDLNARTDVQAAADTRAATNTGQPVTVESASERAGSGLEAGLGESTGTRLSPQTTEKDQHQAPDAWARSPESKSQGPGTIDISQPTGYSKTELLSGRRGSMISSGTFQGVVQDHLALLSGHASYSSESERNPTDLARQLLKKQFVQFASKEERAAVLEEVKTIARRPRNGDGAAQRRAPKVQSLPEAVRKATVESMVAGKYDNEGLLQGQGKFKQPVLDEIARATTINGTYLKEDGERFLKKVRSLLPAATQPSRRAAAR